MIRVTASCYVKPECIEEFLLFTKELVEKTNKLDKGCIRYELCKNESDPLHFVMFEQWEDQDALDNHLNARHFIDLIPRVDGSLSKPTQLIRYSKVY